MSDHRCSSSPCYVCLPCAACGRSAAQTHDLGKLISYWRDEALAAKRALAAHIRGSGADLVDAVDAERRQLDLPAVQP